MKKHINVIYKVIDIPTKPVEPTFADFVSGKDVRGKQEIDYDKLAAEIVHPSENFHLTLLRAILASGKINPDREVFPGQNEIIARAIAKPNQSTGR